MWEMLTILILVIEIILLGVFAIGRLRKRKLNETALFVALVFVLSYSLYAVPFLHRAMVLEPDSDYILGLMDCISPTLKLFVGEAKVDGVEDFAKAVPMFSTVYLLGAILAALATISAAEQVFRNTIRNSFRLNQAMKKDACDIIVGHTPRVLHYAQSCNAVLLLDDSVSKDRAVELIKEGYVVLRKSFTASLFASRRFHASTRYNLICPDDGKALTYIDTFLAYRSGNPDHKNIHLYVELLEENTETIRREIIEKSGEGSLITTFCANELLARTFVEENPVTKYLPEGFVENGALKPDTDIHIFFLGAGKLSHALYRQSVLTNQLVTFDRDTYKLLPIHYHICDKNTDADDWELADVKSALSELDSQDYFPLPDVPYDTDVLNKAPASRNVLAGIKKQVQKGGYSMIFVATEDDCGNIEIGAKLKAMLLGMENFHMFVRSEVSYTEDEARVSYFGKSERVFTHDVIVNDSLAMIAKKLNEVYTARKLAKEKDREDFEQYVRETAEKAWNGFDYFTLYSNIHAAMNLRVQLNLLGLDYVKDGKGNNIDLIKQRHQHRGEYPYEAYFTATARNALIAQEHARWNAYHLLREFLPLEKKDIAARPLKNPEDPAEKPGFDTKNMTAKRHACITTYKGLHLLSSHLAQRAGARWKTQDYEYYVYDENLIVTAPELLTKLGYSIVEK